ncbi:YdcH family protein [Parablastomonas sp. CN1-191]|uniref:YdcH family protein n=1 Tax=Parablastomonas sp. CN1-191 TaxID=3400908 RepID=UPI003BF84322
MEQPHISALQMKHAGLERQINAELSRPQPDLAMLQVLKKKKLRIKEEISHI